MKNRLFSVRKSIISAFLFLTVFSLGAAEYKIDYYGIISDKIDSNMSKMISNLYNTQLSEINSFSVSDMRIAPSLKERPSLSELSSDSLSFFVDITKDEKTDSWIATYCLIDKKNNEEHSKQKNFDSFYKLLKEPKDLLKSTIEELINSEGVRPDTPVFLADSQDSSSSLLISTEELSGTWKGEESINKIVILRGGRGFVIFNNGVSMNISLEISGSDSKKVVVLQKGRSNASFFPELDRSAALNAAIDADPIKWTFTLIDKNNLAGKKDTLLPDGNSYKSGSLDVTWTRVN